MFTFYYVVANGELSENADTFTIRLSNASDNVISTLTAVNRTLIIAGPIIGDIVNPQSVNQVLLTARDIDSTLNNGITEVNRYDTYR